MFDSVVILILVVVLILLLLLLFLLFQSLGILLLAFVLLRRASLGSRYRHCPGGNHPPRSGGCRGLGLVFVLDLVFAVVFVLASILLLVFFFFRLCGRSRVYLTCRRGGCGCVRRGGFTSASEMLQAETP